MHTPRCQQSQKYLQQKGKTFLWFVIKLAEGVWNILCCVYSLLKLIDPFTFSMIEVINQSISAYVASMI